MKKIFIGLLAMLFFIIACQKKSMPVISDRTVQPPAPPKPPEEVHANPMIAAGKTIYTTKCIRCHNAKPVGNWTQREWVPILKSMVKKSKLDSTEKVQVTAYVNEYAKKF